MRLNAHPTGELTEPNASQRFESRDRESFFAAQARNRRATWRISALCVLAAALMGIPLALIITPLLYGVALIIADAVNLFSPLPPEFWRLASEVSRFGRVALDWLLQQKAADPQALAIGVAVMLLPGILFSLALWAGVNLMFRRSGTGGAVLALRAREPNPNELKELQLIDVVQEMAIAAGLPAPQVLLIDAPGANAGIIGASPEDARLIVSRRLIEDLSRDELEGAVAHLIGSIGNGDLRISMRMTAVFEACGLLVAVMNAPFGSQSRRILWRMVRYSLIRREGDPQEAAVVADLLTRSAALEVDDIDRFFDATGKKSRMRSIRNFIFFPIFFTNTAVKLLLWFFSWAALGPLMGLLWHTRQYLADASAVQLTRDPDGLARALQKLNEEPGEIPGGDWASHLFLVRPGRSGNTFATDPQQRQMLAQAWAASTTAASASMPAASSDFAAISRQLPEIMHAAFAGDERATARLRSLYQSVSAADPEFAAQFPNPDDLIAARKSDLEAMSRLRVARPHPSALGQAGKQKDQAPSSPETPSLVGFHASLKRRLKRLALLGAHIDPVARDRKAGIVILALSLLLGPFVLLAILMLLLLIAVMTMASLTFVTIWLAVIHKLFALAGSPTA
jgi:Zn-dependent protease with chaperone function